jgi:pseudouridine synthase
MTILQKFISSAGYCSRRKAEDLIRTGRVKINGKHAELGMSVDKGDNVEIDGQLTKEAREEKIYILLNKPVGYTCTNRKFKGEKNIFELIGPDMPRLFVAGRLDKDSRGLLILTNDGDFAERMTHPRHEKEKEYVVKISNSQFLISKQKQDELISLLVKGIDIGKGDGIVRAKRAEYFGDGKFRIILTEGKKRQIRRMFKALGLEVADLKRVRIGEYKMGDLKEGEYRITHNA